MMRMVRDWGAAVVVGLAVFLFVDWLSSGAGLTGKPAPGFDLVNAAGGNVKLADYAGKTVVLNFWGTWCPPCRAEIPAFAAWSAENADIPILGLADGDSGSGEALQRTSERLGVTWPVLEADAAVIEAYNVQTVPTTVVIGPDGVVKALHRGSLDAAGLDRLVTSAK